LLLNSDGHDHRELTLEELFACVFLEERFVTYRTVKVVDHQSKDRVDLFLGIASIVR
jgi:hypothetical protein